MHKIAFIIVFSVACNYLADCGAQAASLSCRQPAGNHLMPSPEQSYPTLSRQAAESPSRTGNCRLAACAPRKRQGLAELASPGRAPPVLFGCRVADDGLEDAPDVFQQDFVAGGVGMDEIRQIQFGISGYAI